MYWSGRKSGYCYFQVTDETVEGNSDIVSGGRATGMTSFHSCCQGPKPRFALSPSEHQVVGSVGQPSMCGSQVRAS